MRGGCFVYLLRSSSVSSESVEGRGPGLGLQVTHLRLLTALAQTAAQLITQLALEPEHHVQEAEPFPIPPSSPAAREFVATSCDLLLAISEAVPSGTNSESSDIVRVIEIKRGGFVTGLSGESTELSWTNNGAVVHIIIPGANTDGSDTPPVAGSIQLLHPYDCRPVDQPDCSNDDPTWQRQGNRILHEIPPIWSG